MNPINAKTGDEIAHNQMSQSHTQFSKKGGVEKGREEKNREQD